MASKIHTVRFSPALSEAMSLRYKALGYRTLSAYLKALARYDALVQGPHSVTLPWAKLSDDEQDRIDAQLHDVAKRGIGERGQLLTRLIEKAKSTGADPSGEAISKIV